MIESRGADGKLELISEQDYYMRIYRDPADDVCGGCNGARYVRYDRPVGNMLFAKVTPCPRCCPQAVEVPDDARYGT